MRSLLGFFLAVAAAANLSACDPARASVAYVDPILAVAVPEARSWYATAARQVVVLPETDTTAALYADIDSKKPRSIVLSPLLGSEVDAILGRDATTAVIYAGYTSPAPHPRLFTATFSITEPSRMAGTMLAAIGRASGDGLVCAVFAGFPPDAEASASEAFASACAAAGNPGAPRILTIAEPFSQALAEQLRSLDVRAAYLCAPEDQAERWLAQAFDRSATVVVARAFPLRPERTLASVQLVWDMQASLALVDSGRRAGKSGDIAGVWRALPAKSTR